MWRNFTLLSFGLATACDSHRCDDHTTIDREFEVWFDWRDAPAGVYHKVVTSSEGGPVDWWISVAGGLATTEEIDSSSFRPGFLFPDSGPGKTGLTWASGPLGWGLPSDIHVVVTREEEVLLEAEVAPSWIEKPAVTCQGDEVTVKRASVEFVVR